MKSPKYLDERYIKRMVRDIREFTEHKKIIYENFGRLTASEKTIIVARVMNIPIRTICKAFSISPNTVKQAWIHFQSYDNTIKAVTPQEAEWQKTNDDY